MIFAAEIGDVRRFDMPRQLTSFLGLVPGERSTGDTVRRQGLTLAGSRRARRALVAEAGARHCLEGAGAAVRPLPSAQRGRQEAAGGGGRDRARDGGVSLGYRPRGRAYVYAALANLLHKAGGGARWELPSLVMWPGHGPTPVL